MNTRLSVKNLINTIVPISRFNRGGAGKIFDEVRKSGIKVVLKNDVPACVLLTPERYDEMVRQLEDYELYFEAEKRMKQAEKSGFVTSEEIMQEFGVHPEDLENIDVDID
ncbi:MAG: type II toxin-antitoxin system Phd/YefM family antitoxin [Chloroflexi bacterium]|jgi:PHD/YefM family antitoxin component YafN of YafNO toxin-antitoxin module|nr:type II toxin-antitoxin system Phd/YefM family antitoxin [Chloroflexota bacterium]BCY19539.1 hypothetical protein hrd7_33880 [Leptolinea sp. HRD-7]